MDTAPATGERPEEPPEGAARFRLLAQQAQAAYVRERTEYAQETPPEPE